MDFEKSQIKQRDLKRIWLASKYSWMGLRAAYREEPAFRYEVHAAMVLIPLAVWLADTFVAGVAMIGAVLFVLLIELINSAIEAAIDRIGPERHELSARAKDLGSAAVAVAIVIAILVWVAVLI